MMVESDEELKKWTKGNRTYNNPWRWDNGLL